MSRILVLNATGKVSAHLIERLTTAGHAVTAGSRRPTAGSTEQLRRVPFDYTDPTTWTAALADVDRLFWVGPPMVLDAAAHCLPFFDAALPQLRKVVLMTAAGVEHSDEIPMRRVELHVEASGVPFTFLRPSWFHDNFHTFWVGGLQAAGVLALPAADAATAFIDARDIGDAAFAALTDPATDGSAFTLTGPEALTYAQAAAVLSEAAGRELRYLPVSDDAFVAGAAGAGVPEAYARFFTQLFAVVRMGGAAAVSDAVPRLTGRPARTLKAYAAEHAAAWR
jgi:uncharacterized protein YbjT (DUF2867 family)